MSEVVMNWNEYNKLFHIHKLNLVAFKRLMDCDEEVLKLVNAAIAAEREACAKVCDVLADKHTFEGGYANECAEAIRARGQHD
jgi:hypothetical protein